MSEVAPSSAEHPSDAASATDWEDPPWSAASGAAPMLSVAGFEGPLDWLLEMARAKKVDLAKLPIADLIQCFGDAFEAALGRAGGIGSDLGLWGAWLVMAATLTDLRSRLLLPGDAAQARQALNEADALRRQIVFARRCALRRTGWNSASNSGATCSRVAAWKPARLNDWLISLTCCAPA